MNTCDQLTNAGDIQYVIIFYIYFGINQPVLLGLVISRMRADTVYRLALIMGIKSFKITVVSFYTFSLLALAFVINTWITC
jgi:hypothetical protein